MNKVRVATAEDAEAILQIYAPHIRQTAVTFDEHVPDVSEVRQLITERLKTFPWLVAVNDTDNEGAVVGYAYASSHRPRDSYRWSVDTSIYIDSSHQRRGIGRLLYQHLLPIVQRQGYRMAHAGVTLPNEASVKLHESLGFQLAGVFPKVGFKLGTWHDVGWWHLDLAPTTGDAPMAETTPFADLR